MGSPFCGFGSVFVFQGALGVVEQGILADLFQRLLAEDMLCLAGILCGDVLFHAQLHEEVGQQPVAADLVEEELEGVRRDGRELEVVERVSAYDGVADSIKLSPPTHGIAAQDTRVAQDAIIDMIAEFTGAHR